MRLKNNKGSSMLLVIVLITVLVTLSAALMLVITTNYKAKQKESSRIKNLYEAEAGLDVAYNVIVKAFEAAEQSGNKAVSVTEDAINERMKNGEEIDNIEAKKDNAFQNAFIHYIGVPDNNETEENDGYEIDRNLFSYCLNRDNSKYQYVKYKSDYSEDSNFTYDENTNKEYKNIEMKTKTNQPQISCKVYFNKVKYKEYDEDKDKDDYEYTVVLNSKFEDESITGKDKREVQVKYTVKVPYYKGTNTYYSNISHDLDTKAIMIDGNMKINGKNNQQFNINGDIFVKGNNNSDLKQDIVYNKYKGGIEIAGPEAANVNFNGNVVTSETFNVSSPKSHVTNKDEKNNSFKLYAGNVYIGNKDGTASKDSTVDLNDVITDNDFVVKSKNSQITMENFYGINDKNISTNSSENKEETSSNISGDEEKSSSSIIVNNDKNTSEESSIKVKNNAYIMGTAYINAKNSEGQYYQTGESVAIKGNYIAYTIPLDKFKNYNFGTYGLLQLVDSKKNEKEKDESLLNVIDKSKYFEEFVKNYPEDITTGGVILNKDKTHAVGAVVYKENNELVVETSDYNYNIDQDVLDMREEYAKEVCMIGNLEGKDPSEIYDNQVTNQKTIENNIINFSKINGYEDKNTSNQRLVLNEDADKTIVISNKDISVGNNEKLVKVDGDTINALIISNGNVRLDGNFEFNGAIISHGDLDILNREDKNINYNKNIVNQIIKDNTEDLNGVFREANSSTENNLPTEDSNTTNYSYQHDTKDYINSKEWKIIRNG